MAASYKCTEFKTKKDELFDVERMIIACADDKGAKVRAWTEAAALRPLSRALGWLYERQQHLLVTAVMLALCAAAARGAARRARPVVRAGRRADVSLDVVAMRAHVATLAFALFVALASTSLARVVRF